MSTGSEMRSGTRSRGSIVGQSRVCYSCGVVLFVYRMPHTALEVFFIMENTHSIKKVGGRKVLHSQSRKIISNVYKFTKSKAKNGVLRNLKQVQNSV